MGGAILKGYISTARADGNKLFVCGKNQEKTKTFSENFGVTYCETVEELVDCCGIFFIGVKPNTIVEVLNKVKEKYTKDKVCISMAAGIMIDKIAEILGSEAKIIRIMPNTPAQIGEAMTSASRNKNVTEKDFEVVMKILNSVGISKEVDESLIHCVIGISGSSPAYTYMYIAALIEAATKNGMSRDTATTFAAQSVIGAAKMVLLTGINPEILRDNVCSPGGTTIEGVEKLKDLKFSETIAEAFQAVVDKSIKMSKN